MPDKLRMEQRITIPGVIKRIEEQTNGEVGKEYWFPIPCAKQVTDFVEAIKQKPKYRLSVHFSCGMATYVFKDGEKMVPLPKFFDVEGFFNYLGELTKEVTNARHKKIKTAYIMTKLLKNISKYVDDAQKPQDLPAEWAQIAEVGDDVARLRRIADFIAGMTDRYALGEHQRLFDSTPELR